MYTLVIYIYTRYKFYDILMIQSDTFNILPIFVTSFTTRTQYYTFCNYRRIYNYVYLHH